MRLLVFVATAAICAISNGDEWIPPANVDVNKLLSEARADARAGRNDVALQKFVWFHEHAMEKNKALAGVRLSFALNYWFDLAKDYPPAMEALKATRDDAGRRALKEKDAQPFQDFITINRKLNEESKSVDLFLDIAEKDEKRARELYRRVQPMLVRAKRYDVCGQFIDPESLQQSIDMFNLNRSSKVAERNRAQLQEFGRKKFANESATLVALLAVNRRQKEAKEVAIRARKVLDDPAFQNELDNALAGKVPDPWP
jgi:hypothetical protein